MDNLTTGSVSQGAECAERGDYLAEPGRDASPRPGMSGNGGGDTGGDGGVIAHEGGSATAPQEGATAASYDWASATASQDRTHAAHGGTHAAYGSVHDDAAETHQPWLDGRWLMPAFCAFAVYAAAAAIWSRGQDAIWAAWAVPGYIIAAVMVRRPRGRDLALLIAVAAAVAVPLLWLLASGALADGMAVIQRSASLMLRHGTPYLPSRQLSSWLSYNPYLPAMALFGLPWVAGLRGIAGNPALWLALATVAILAVAFWNMVPHRAKHCPQCRRDVLRCTAFAAACPLMALNLAVTTTDPPVLALMLLSLSLAAQPSRTTMSAVALGVACAMKSIAWFAVPVIAVTLRSRDGMRAAVRFTATSVLATLVSAATAPAALASPADIVQNTVLFPLGLTARKTPAQSLLPGHLLAAAGPVGHAVSVGLLLTSGLAVAASLVIRPPRDLAAATLRLALGLALMFTLGPAERFGYFIYPLGLVGWLIMTRRRATPGGVAPDAPRRNGETASAETASGETARP